MNRQILIAVLLAAPAATASPLPDFPFRHVPVTVMNVNSGKCMDVVGTGTANGTRVQQATCVDRASQTFSLIWVGGDDYMLRLSYDGRKNLDIAGASTSDGAALQIYDIATQAQVFQILASTGGGYTFVAKNSGRCLDVPGGSTANGVLLQQYGCHGGANQRWTITPRQTAFHLIAEHSQQCLDVTDASTADGKGVQQFHCLDQDNQRWSLGASSVVGGVTYWEIKAKHSGKCLGKDPTSSNVAQSSCTGGDAQKWSLTTRADGFVTFANKATNSCLDIAGASSADRAVALVFACTGNTNQAFYWGRFRQRHVEIVQVATSAGTGRQSESDVAVADHLARAAAIYRKYGLDLLYDPAADKTSLDSDALYHLGSGGTYACANGLSSTPEQCAAVYAQTWADKVVVFARPGGDYTYADAPFIAIGTLQPSSALVCNDVPDTQWLARAIGFHLGLTLSHVEYGSAADADLALQNANLPNTWNHGAWSYAIFDADRVGDTAPVPFLGDSCLAPHYPIGDVVLDSTQILEADTDNVMSYYYNDAPRITPQQAEIVRAGMLARGW